MELSAHRSPFLLLSALPSPSGSIAQTVVSLIRSRRTNLRRRGDDRAMRGAERALLAVIDSRTTTDQILNIVELSDLVALFDVATAHRVVGVVHKRLIDAGVDLPEGLAARLDRERLRSAALQLAAHQSIGAVAAAIDRQFLVVKGPILGSLWYGDPTLRRFGDIDLLVRRQRLRRCHRGVAGCRLRRALDELGRVSSFTAWRRFRSRTRTQWSTSIGIWSRLERLDGS